MTRNVLLEAHNFWASSSKRTRDFAHIRGTGRWRDEEAWLRIGRGHLEQFCSYYDDGMQPLRSLLEWGPGGGSNIVAFSRVFEEATVVDISIDALRSAVMAVKDLCPGFETNAFPLTIDAPSAALKLGANSFDFLICTAVIQHMPSVEHFIETAGIWNKLLRPGAYGLVQFRTRVGCQAYRKKKKENGGAYKHNVSRWMMLRQKEFIPIVEGAGFEVLDIVNGEERTATGYAYAWLKNK